MTVYIEYLFINNLLINFILLKTSANIARSKTTFFSLSISSLIGAIFSIILPFTNNFLLPFIKILIGLLLSLVSIKYSNFKIYICNFISFMMFTFFLGGALIAIEEIFNINHQSKLNLLIQFVPVTIIAIFGYVFVLRIRKNKNLYPYVYDCLINIEGNAYKTSGFVDTGNQAYYKETPIIFCNKNLSKKIEMDLKKVVTYSSNITTMAGCCNVKIIKDVNLLIYYDKDKHIHKNVVLGLTNRKLKYDIFLNPDVINGGRYAG